MIYILTLNPVLDIIISVDSLSKGGVNKTELNSVTAGGKGFNVSRALNCLGVKNNAVAVCGGIIGKDIEKLLQDEGIDSDIIPMDENTRINVKLIEKEYGKMTELNNPGPLVDPDKIRGLLEFIRNINPKPEFFVISGSLPPGIDESFYSEVINICRSCNIKTLLDTSGKPLYYGILAVPDILKVNHDELCDVSEKYFHLKPEELAGKLIDDGLNIIMITNGAGEIRYYDRSGSYIITPPDVRGLYATGSGDCVNAGFIYAVCNNFKIVDMLKFSVACGSANILNETPGKIDRTLVQELIAGIKVRKTDDLS